MRVLRVLPIAVRMIAITVGGIVLFCVSVFLSFWIAKTIRGVLSQDVLPNMTLPRGVANSVSTMSYYFLLLLGLVFILPLLTGLSGWCPPYSVLGINTCRAHRRSADE